MALTAQPTIAEFYQEINDRRHLIGRDDYYQINASIPITAFNAPRNSILLVSSLRRRPLLQSYIPQHIFCYFITYHSTTRRDRAINAGVRRKKMSRQLLTFRRHFNRLAPSQRRIQK